MMKEGKSEKTYPLFVIKRAPLIMKRLSTALCLLFIFTVAWAEPVTQQRAIKYATAYLDALTQQKVTMRNMETVGTGSAAYHIVNFYPQGWVIVSGDDVAAPVIGYSKTGSLSTKSMPENMKGALNGFVEEIKYVTSTSNAIHPRWNGTSAATRGEGESVGPLIEVHWNQSEPFNKYCPMGKTLVGCVAVSMSQAMSVQRYPDRPQGSISYNLAEYGTMSINFDEQKAYNWTQIMNGDNNYDETARLLMHAGMSVQMNYGEDGSGVPISQMSRVVTALETSFKYPNSVRLIKRETYDGNWEQLLKNELNAGRVIIYNGLDTKRSEGHSWNIDGYNVDGFYHCNWGWGGYGDGYFSLNGLGYGSSYFDSTHIIIIGIDAGNRPLRSIELSNYNIEEKLPAGSVVGKITVNSKDVTDNLTVSVHGTYNKSLDTFQDVPFIYENGLLKTSEALQKGKKWTIEITVSDGTNKLTQGFVVNVTETLDLATATSITYDRMTQLFTIITKNNVNYTLKDANGTIIRNGALSPLPQLNLYRQELSTGENTLTLWSANESITLTLKK